MMKSLFATVAILAACLPVGLEAQPAELYRCLGSGGPDCGIESILQIDLCANRSFLTYFGRAAWFPLRNDGPVVIDLEANPSYATHFPLYVEIVPIQLPIAPDFCLNGHPGIVVGETYGTGWCGAEWVSFGPVDLRPIVPLGGTYALQFVFFRTVDAMVSSPGINCVRVRLATPSSIASAGWGRVKTLYR